MRCEERAADEEEDGFSWGGRRAEGCLDAGIIWAAWRKGSVMEPRRCVWRYSREARDATGECLEEESRVDIVADDEEGG